MAKQLVGTVSFRCPATKRRRPLGGYVAGAVRHQPRPVRDAVQRANATPTACRFRSSSTLQRPHVRLRDQKAAGGRPAEEARRDRPGSGVPNKEKVGKVTRQHLEDVAKQKMQDLNARDLEHAVDGRRTARSLGLVVGLVRTYNDRGQRQAATGDRVCSDQDVALVVNHHGSAIQALPAAKKAPTETVDLETAVARLKDFGNTKFNQSVEVAMRLGIDARQADNWFAARWCCPTASAKRCGWWFRQGDAVAVAEGPEPTPSATTAKRSRTAGSISTFIRHARHDGRGRSLGRARSRA